METNRITQAEVEKVNLITKANRIKDKQKYYIDLYILTLELVF